MMTLCAERALEQLGALGERGRQELVARQEQHGELGAALELRPVGLGGELAHARFDLLRVPAQAHLALLVARRLERGQIGIERRLGIDHQVARIGHVHHEIRAQRALRADQVQLLGEVAVLGEAGELDQAAQGQLAPAAAHLRTAQRGDQIARLALQLRLAAGEGLDLRAQAREGIAPLALERLHLRFGALERDAQRLDQLRDRHLALLERALGDHLVAPERLARQTQEQLAVGAQGLPGEGIERGAQARLGLLEQAHPLGCPSASAPRGAPAPRRARRAATRCGAPRGDGSRGRRARARQERRAASRCR